MSESPEAVVRAVYAAYFAQDLPAFLARLDPRVAWWSIGPPTLPFAGRYQGPAGVGQFFEAFDSAVEVIDFHLDERLIVDGDCVVATGPRAVKVRTTGKRVDTPWLHWWRIADGLVVAHREYQDTAAFLVAMQT